MSCPGIRRVVSDAWAGSPSRTVHTRNLFLSHWMHITAIVCHRSLPQNLMFRLTAHREKSCGAAKQRLDLIRLP